MKYRSNLFLQSEMNRYYCHSLITLTKKISGTTLPIFFHRTGMADILHPIAPRNG